MPLLAPRRGCRDALRLRWYYAGYFFAAKISRGGRPEARSRPPEPSQHLFRIISLSLVFQSRPHQRGSRRRRRESRHMSAKHGRRSQHARYRSVNDQGCRITERDDA